MNETRWDVAVIGGGPAGSSAAIELARQGLRVALFESKTYPHDKMCGEFLSPECSGLLETLQLTERLKNINPPAIHSAVLTAPDGNAWETSLPGTALGLSRKTLDAALADEARKAGVYVQEASNVTGCEGNLSEGFTLDIMERHQRSTIQARSVISAHGKRSGIDRAYNRQFLQKHQPFIAMKAHFRGPPIPKRIELHAFPGGYCGLSEIEEGKKVVCLLVHEQTFQNVCGKKSPNLDAFIDWMMAQNIYLGSWMQWAERIHERWITTAQISFVRKPVLEGDVIMAGDSAGLIVPLAGNGIAMALEGGILAARWLARYLISEMSASDLRFGYASAWERRFGPRLNLARALQPLMFRPRMISFALRLMNAFPPAGRFLVARTRGTVKTAGQGSER